MDWRLMTAEAQLSACAGGAGTLSSEPGIRVVESGFTSQKIDQRKIAAGAYRNARLTTRSEWLGVYARVLGLQEGDAIDVTIAGPDGTILYSAYLKVKPDAGGDTVFKLDDRKEYGFRKAGHYVGRFQVMRNGRGVFNWSQEADLPH
jgi:hypothetical protein